MAATITETYAQDLVARATAAGITEDEFKTVTGWDFGWAEHTTHNRAQIIERMIDERAPAPAPAPRPGWSTRGRGARIGTCHSCGASVIWGECEGCGSHQG